MEKKEKIWGVPCRRPPPLGSSQLGARRRPGLVPALCVPVDPVAVGSRAGRATGGIDRCRPRARRRIGVPGRRTCRRAPTGTSPPRHGHQLRERAELDVRCRSLRRRRPGVAALLPAHGVEQLGGGGVASGSSTGGAWHPCRGARAPVHGHRRGCRFRRRPTRPDRTSSSSSTSRRDGAVSGPVGRVQVSIRIEANERRTR